MLQFRIFGVFNMNFFLKSNKINQPKLQNTYLIVKCEAGFSETVADCFGRNIAPSLVQDENGVQQIEFEVSARINCCNSTTEQSLSVIHFQILDDALIHWLKSKKLLKTFTKGLT